MRIGDIALPKNAGRIIDSDQGHYRVDLGAIAFESFLVTLTFQSSTELRGLKSFIVPFTSRPVISVTVQSIVSGVTIFDIGSLSNASSTNSTAGIRLGVIRNGSRNFVAGDIAIVHVVAIGEAP